MVFNCFLCGLRRFSLKRRFTFSTVICSNRRSLSSALAKGTGMLKRRLKPPKVASTFSPAAAAASSSPESPKDRPDSFAPISRVTPSHSPLVPEIASKVFASPSEFVSARESLSRGRSRCSNKEAGIEGGEQVGTSPVEGESGEDEKQTYSIGHGSSGLLKVWQV